MAVSARAGWRARQPWRHPRGPGSPRATGGRGAAPRGPETGPRRAGLRPRPQQAGEGGPDSEVRHPGVGRGAERLPERERGAGGGHDGGGFRPAPPRAARWRANAHPARSARPPTTNGSDRRLGAARGGGEEPEHGELAAPEGLEPSLERKREADEQHEAAGGGRAAVHGRGEVAVERSGAQAQEVAGIRVEESHGGACQAGAGVAEDHSAGVGELQCQQADPEQRGERQQAIRDRGLRPVGGLGRQGVCAAGGSRAGRPPRAGP